MATSPFALSETVSGQQQAQANAVALLLHHPALMQLDPVPTKRIIARIEQIDVSDLMMQILSAGDGWVSRAPIVDGGGRPVVDPKTGDALYTLLLSQDVASALRGPLRAVLAMACADPQLAGWAWSSQNGVLDVPLAASEAPFEAAGLGPRYGLSVAVTAGDSTSLTLACTNHGSRVVALFAQFLDKSGTPFAPAGWADRLPSGLSAVFEPDPTKRYVAIVAPARWPGEQPPASAVCTAVPLPLAEDASAVRLLLAAPGTGPYDPATCPIGVAASFVVFDAIACAATVAGAVPSASAFAGFLSSPTGLLAVLPAFAALARKPLADAIAAAGNMSPALGSLRESLGAIVFATTLADAIDAAVGSGAAAASALDLGVVLQVAAAAAAPSPPVAGASWEPFVVEIELDRAADAALRVEPAQWLGSFPPPAVAYAGMAVPSGGGTPRTFGGTIDPINGGAAIAPGTLPSRDIVRITAALSDAGGTTIAAGAGTWRAGATASVAVVAQRVDNGWSGTFEHRKKLVYDAEHGGHLWRAASAPAETVTWQSPDPKHSISNFVDVTYAQAPAMIGYAYEAVGIAGDGGSARYTVQNIAGFGPPEGAYRAPESGWESPARIVYERGGPAAGDGLNFLLSPGAAGYHLRRLRLDARLAFDPPDATSWGCFVSAPDGLAVHPAGCVVGISYDPGVLSVLWLADSASSEADAPRARIASGPGSRPGLLSGPVALCVGGRGELLVLEGPAGRVQALDLYANPVNRFGGSPYMALVDAPGAARLLDLASGPRGELHVLSYTGDGSNPAEYHLDVFTADGTHLGRTGGVAAAKIVVTRWGDVLALDYEQIAGADGRTEPAVSVWTRV